MLTSNTILVTGNIQTATKNPHADEDTVIVSQIASETIPLIDENTTSFADRVSFITDTYNTINMHNIDENKIPVYFSIPDTPYVIEVTGEPSCGYESHMDNFNIARNLYNTLKVIAEIQIGAPHEIAKTLIEDHDENGYDVIIVTNKKGETTEVVLKCNKGLPVNIHICICTGNLVIPFLLFDIIRQTGSYNTFKELCDDFHKYEIPTVIGTIYVDAEKVVASHNKVNDYAWPYEDMPMCVKCTKENWPFIMSVGLTAKYKSKYESAQNKLDRIKDMVNHC